MPRRNSNNRNQAARSPLMRKGGPHVKSKTGQRLRSRLATDSAIDDWLDELEKERDDQEKKDGEQMLPVDLKARKNTSFYVSQ